MPHSLHPQSPQEKYIHNHSGSKSKEKSTDKKHNHISTKAIKQHNDTALHYHPPTTKKNIGSPFKHKSIHLGNLARPISNLAGARHAKNIDHQLSHLNESVFRNESTYMEDSGKRGKTDSHTGRLMEEARKLMKGNHFDQAIGIFQECLRKDEDNIEALYLLGVSAFHL